MEVQKVIAAVCDEIKERLLKVSFDKGMTVNIAEILVNIQGYKNHPSMLLDDLILAQAQGKREGVAAVCDGIKELLIWKNTAYGSAFYDPLRIFSKASAEEQLLVRIDDKLSRLMRGQQLEKVQEDTERDLIGYLVLERVLKALTPKNKGGRRK